MGNIWLLDLPDVISKYSVSVKTVKGWETRSRSSGGYDGLWGIGTHHTASNATPENDMNWMWFSSSNNAKPIGALYIDREGVCWIGAAGATNTQGAGGPVQTSRGTIPENMGNRYILSIEAANNGRGEVWPNKQIDAYERVLASLCSAYGLQTTDIISHARWSPRRKVDPSGPTPLRPTWGGTSGNATWSDREVSLTVKKRIDDFQNNIKPGGPMNTHLFGPVRILDTRTDSSYKRPLNAGETIYLPPHKDLPKNAKALLLNVTAVNAQGQNFLTLWSGKGGRPKVSNLNTYEKGQTVGNMAIVQLGDFNTFALYSEKGGHVIIDIQGYLA
jgi:hypothetical protein